MPAPRDDAAPDNVAGDLTVFAAASLRDVFTRLGDAFTTRYPAVTLRFNFAGTQELRTQIVHGARADLFASADTHHMAALVAAGHAQTPTIFAANKVVLIVPRGSTRAPTSLASLPDARRVIVGAADVPIGRYTMAVLDKASALFGDDFRARVEARVVSRELNVRQVLAKVRLGEVDAGFVYATDAALAPDAVTVVPLPPEVEVTTDYPIAALADAPNRAAADAWLSFLSTDEARAALSAAGFTSPRPQSAAP